MEAAEVAERGLSALLPVSVQEITLHPASPINRGIERGGGTFVFKSFCILPGPERGGGRVGIVPWHQVFSFDGVAEFVQSLVYGSPGLSDVHEEIFTYGPDAVETRGFGDLAEFVFVCGEGDPWGPGEGEPGFGEVFFIGEFCGELVGIGRHA